MSGRRVAATLQLVFLLLFLGRSARASRDREDPAYLLGKELRCPVCQGMPIAESPSPMAQDMMKQVRGMLAAGKSPAQVRQYYVERFGEWVLLRPPPHGFNWLVWLGPPAAFLLLGALSFAALRKGRPSASPAAVAKSDAGVGDAGAASPYAAAIAAEMQGERHG